MNALGRTTWVIAEGYIPSRSGGHAPGTESHETACILNTGGTPARIEVLVYYTDREPSGPYTFEVPPRRTLHLRFDEFDEPAIPRDTDYASVITADTPVVVQHTRLDSRQAELALMTAVAYPA